MMKRINRRLSLTKRLLVRKDGSDLGQWQSVWNGIGRDASLHTLPTKKREDEQCLCLQLGLLNGLQFHSNEKK